MDSPGAQTEATSSECGFCKHIDIRKTLLREPSALDRPEYPDEPFESGNKHDDILATVRLGAQGLGNDPSPLTGCSFCKLVISPQVWSEGHYCVFQENFLDTHHEFRRDVYRNHRNLYRRYCSIYFRLGGKYLFLPEDHTALLRPRPIKESFNHELAGKWLAKCRTLHHDKCSLSSKDFPTRLIDCDTRTVVPGYEGIRYVALSYVWGKHEQESELAANRGTLGSLPSKLPGTIDDAMTVTRQLGYRYIWVDMYCINQADAADKHSQIIHMDAIYTCAEMTIIVAAGDNCYYGIPGVGRRARQIQDYVDLNGDNLCILGAPVSKEIHNSTWWARGWTFQEALLSRRRLVFTESQMYFECSTAAAVEGIGGLELIRTRKELQIYQDIFGTRVFHSFFSGNRIFEYGGFQEAIHSAQGADLNMKMFQHLARTYTSKTLSFESDALNAFSAIGTAFAKAQQSASVPYQGHGSAVLNLSGVPCDSSLIREVREISLTNGLLWYYTFESVPQRRRYAFPSWTWAGFEGVADWRPWVDRSLWHIDGIEEECGGIYDIMELEEFLPLRKHAASSLVPRAIHITAPVVKPSVWNSLHFADGKWRGARGSPWRRIFASPISHNFHRASSRLIPNLRSGVWSALCSGSSRHSGMIVFYLIEKRQEDNRAIRIGLAEMRFAWPSSQGENALLEDNDLKLFIEQGTETGKFSIV
ncbi:hypothetical protein AAE478_000245 [Parahypoxylon ruwenzoriense]